MKKPQKYWGFGVVIAAGFEPATVCLEGRCSIQLSYATLFRGCKDTNVCDCKKYFFLLQTYPLQMSSITRI